MIKSFLKCNRRKTASWKYMWNSVTRRKGNIESFQNHPDWFPSSGSRIDTNQLPCTGTWVSVAPHWPCVSVASPHWMYLPSSSPGRPAFLSSTTEVPPSWSWLLTFASGEADCPHVLGSVISSVSSTGSSSVAGKQLTSVSGGPWTSSTLVISCSSISVSKDSSTRAWYFPWSSLSCRSWEEELLELPPALFPEWTSGHSSADSSSLSLE